MKLLTGSYRTSPLLTGIFLLFFSISGMAQIVNTENSKMDTDTVGWKGSLSANLGLSKYVQRFLSINGKAHIQYKAKKSLWILLAYTNFLKGGDSKYVDSRLIHLRYSTKLARRFHWEAFGQAEDNKIAKLKYRLVFGTGPRMKLFSNKFIHMHIAAHLTYENENEQTIPETEHSDFRLSGYVAFVITPAERVEITSTTFFQPLISDFNDSRVLNQVNIKISANKHFGMSLQWNYFHDRNPVKLIPETQYSLSAGLSYDF